MFIFFLLQGTLIEVEASNLAHGEFSFPNQRLPVPKMGISTPFQSVCGSILSSKRGKILWGFFRGFLGTFCIKSQKITRYHEM